MNFVSDCKIVFPHRSNSNLKPKVENSSIAVAYYKLHPPYLSAMKYLKRFQLKENWRRIISYVTIASRHSFYMEGEDWGTVGERDSQQEEPKSCFEPSYLL